MIAGISKAVTLYLAPVLALTATVLSLFAFLAPTLLLQDRVALVTITPSTMLVQPAGNQQNVDGPSLFIGSLGACVYEGVLFFFFSFLNFGFVFLGSCVKSNNDAQLNCTFPSVSPQYGKRKYIF